MAQNAVQNDAPAINPELTDPREAYEAMGKLVSETENELGRIHGELDVMTQAWQAMTWNDYEFDVDAWHRLMSRTVAQVETLRAHVEKESCNRHLRKTEAERADAARKDKVVDVLLQGAKAAVSGTPDVLDKIVVGMAAIAPEVDAMDEKSKLKAFELFGSMVDAAIAEKPQE
ncbi:MAG: hypothetical protein GXY42_04340 [Desulfovibrionales bacterium]|nr:hypothetical protein [Desulfovibrionales bacterium]